MSRVASGFSASARAAPGWPLRAFFTRVASATPPFLTARRRQRRVVRRLRRLTVLGFEVRDAGPQRPVLCEQLLDTRREPADLLQQPRRLHVVSERINLCRRHASLNQPAWKSSTPYTQVTPPQRGE